MIERSAIFSKCRNYRYALSRIWIERNVYCLFVCLNPSTADENIDDPTIRRCIRFAESFGCGGMVMVNLFAYRSTWPEALLNIDDPIGSDNDLFIQKLSQAAKITVAAWGSHKAIKQRADNVLLLLKNPQYLELTKDKKPRHPLYLKKTLRPKPFKSVDNEKSG